MSRTVSKKFECYPYKKIALDDPYIHMDIDRFISFLEQEVAKMDNVIKNYEGTLYEDYKLRTELETIKDSYEGLLGMIKSNSFR